MNVFFALVKCLKKDRSIYSLKEDKEAMSLLLLLKERGYSPVELIDAYQSLPPPNPVRRDESKLEWKKG